jgi:hypothetical protein
MSLTKASFSMITGSELNLLDFIPQAEHSAIRAGTSTYDCTSAIKAAVATGRGRIYIPAGVYMCDPIYWNTGNAPNLSTITMVGDGSGYNGTYAATSTNISTIRCRTPATIFWNVYFAHRFQMINVSLDANNLCATVYKLEQGCTHNLYSGSSFVNCQAGGIALQLGDGVINIQVDWNYFFTCYIQNTNSIRHGRSVVLAGSNTINNSFVSCRLMQAITHIQFTSLCQTTLVEDCDFQDYTEYAILSSGHSPQNIIRRNYTESPTGLGFYLDLGVFYFSSSQGPTIIADNLLQAAGIAASITVASQHEVIVTGNRSISDITVIPPDDPTLYYVPQISYNQVGSIVDTVGVAMQYNNILFNVGLMADAGQIIATDVGNGATAAAGQRRGRKPIQIGSVGIYQSGTTGIVSGNVNFTNLESNAVGYSQAITLGTGSGVLGFRTSTTAAAASGDVLSYVGSVVNGTTSSFEGLTNNTMSLGRSAVKWTEVFATNGTINTSDAREKQQIRSLSDAEKAVAVKCKGLLKAFKWNDAVAKKNEKARIHFGVIAQEVGEAFTSEGLDPTDYAMFCYDKWDDEFDDNEGLRVTAGDRYGVRYSQLLAFIIASL